MSDTIVDMPKVTQMLDAGWYVYLHKNRLGTYTALADHEDDEVMHRTRNNLIKLTRANVDCAKRIADAGESIAEWVDDFHYDDECLMTDDFTPEQALTRLAYKAVGGEIL